MREGHKPLGVINDAKRQGIDAVIVGVSGGMDSVAVLDLCLRHFSVVRPYFMYVVKGMSFQERYLTYLERRFNVEIDRVPHWMLSRLLAKGILRHHTNAAAELRQCRPAHFSAFIRRRTGLQWIVTGEKASDSLERNTQFVQDGGVQPKRHRLYPLAWWSSSDVQSYLATQRINLPPDYRLNDSNHEALRTKRGASFGGIVTMGEIVQIAHAYPEDLEKIRRVFPLIDVQLQRWRQLNERGLVDNRPRGSEVCRRAGRRRKQKPAPATENATTTGASDGKVEQGEQVEGQFGQ